jgi:hypothetical protein
MAIVAMESVLNTDHLEQWRGYLSAASKRAGGDQALGHTLGLADGSRIGKARRDGSPLSELVCVRLARFMEDDPLRVLRLAGHEEMSSLLSGAVMPKIANPQVSQLARALETVKELTDLALSQVKQEGTYGKKEGRRR